MSELNWPPPEPKFAPGDRVRYLNEYPGPGTPFEIAYWHGWNQEDGHVYADSMKALWKECDLELVPEPEPEVVYWRRKNTGSFHRRSDGLELPADWERVHVLTEAEYDLAVRMMEACRIMECPFDGCDCRWCKLTNGPAATAFKRSKGNE